MRSGDGLRVVIAHASRPYTSALTAVLSELRGVDVVATVSSVHAAATAADLLGANTVIVSENLDTGGAEQAAKELAAAATSARVVAVCPHLSVEMCRRRLSSAVDSVISEDARLPAWRDALRPPGRYGSDHDAPRS
jgi:DNA-binding NarL/FixJ family response regulator